MSQPSTPIHLQQWRKMQPPPAVMPLAIVNGEPVNEAPRDLYIPPDALEVFLETFEGPLDLLLYLIKRQNIDIVEINVADITKQYMQYIALMEAAQFELAAEYLLMAAMLAEIKSRLLLPRPASNSDDEEEDPRAELIKRLQEYERCKQAADHIDQLPRLYRDHYPAAAQPVVAQKSRPLPNVELKQLLLAFNDVLRRAQLFEHHHVNREKLSTRERMSQILTTLTADTFTPFTALFAAQEGRLGVIVTFLAVMELLKESLIELVQPALFGAIHIKAKCDGQ